MKISGSDLSMGIGSIQQVNGQNNIFQNASVSSGTSDDAIQTDISDTGKRVGGMMDRARRMPPPPKEKMDEMRTSIEELNLDDVDVDSLTDEEVLEHATIIDELMESFKPAEDTSESPVDLDNMSISEQRAFVSSFKSSSQELLDNFDEMDNMMGGRPPKGKKPPKESQGINATQMAIESYESLSSTEFELDLETLENLLDALEKTDDSDEDDSSSALNEFVSDYLSFDIV